MITNPTTTRQVRAQATEMSALLETVGDHYRIIGSGMCDSIRRQLIAEGGVGGPANRMAQEVYAAADEIARTCRALDDAFATLRRQIENVDRYATSLRSAPVSPNVMFNADV